MGPWLIEVADRDDLHEWLASESPDPSKTVRMILRGDSPQMRLLLPNAMDAAKKEPGRVVVWIRNDSLLTDPENAAFFDGGPEVVGVVIAGGSVHSWVYDWMSSVEQTTQAFEEAEASTSN